MLFYYHLAVPFHPTMYTPSAYTTSIPTILGQTLRILMRWSSCRMPITCEIVKYTTSIWYEVNNRLFICTLSPRIFS